MELPKISIIVPVFKAEEYLESSISQLRSQDYPNLEIILVDDGSPDNSGIICDKYSAVDSRIIVVHKRNGGASDARNTGLEIATGEYVCFADSDDIVSPSYVSHLYRDFCSNQLTDFVLQGFIQKWEDREKVFKSYSGIYDLKGGGLDRLFCDIYINDYSGPYCKLFRKSILDENQIRFSTEIIYAEDFDFLLRYIPHVRCIVASNVTNYVYLMHSDSVSSKIYSFEKELSGLRQLGSSFDKILPYCKSKDFLLIRGNSLSYYVIRLITANYKHNYSQQERINNLRQIDQLYINDFMEYGTTKSIFLCIIGKFLSSSRLLLLDILLCLRLKLIYK